MDEEIKKKLESGLLYGFFELENKNKINKINRIKQEFMEQINKLKEEKGIVIKKAVSLLEERKIKELEEKL